MDYIFDYFLLFYIGSIGSFSMCGMGLFVMGKQISIRKLLVIALISSALISPVWLLPISNGTKVYLTVLLLIVMLLRTQKYSFFICTAAVLLGMSINTILEFAFTFFIEFNPSWLSRVLWATPGAAVGAGISILGQIWLSKRPAVDRFENRFSVRGVDEKGIFTIVPLVQLISAFFVVMVTSAVIFHPIVGRFLPFILYSAIVLSFYFSRKPFPSGEKIITPMDIIDLIFIAPVIVWVMLNSGGVDSPWKVLFIPLIMANALKKNKFYGVLSVLIATGTILYMGIFRVNGGLWSWEVDLGYFVVFLFVFWVLRYFVSREKELREEVENARWNVLANISHDLRNPVTLIKGYAEMLSKKGELNSQKIKGYLQVILEKSHNLLRQTEKLQELADLERAAVFPKMEKVSSTFLLEKVYRSYEMVARNRGLYLKLEDVQELKIEADFDLLERVFANLIFNAFQFTPEDGNISIGVGKTNNGKEALFRLSDTGPGMEKSEQEKIFDRFYKGKNNNKKGSGLGLAIAREIVELHGGRIRVESEKGSGTTFFFSIPLAEKKAVLEEERKKTSVSDSGKRPLVQIFLVLLVGAVLLGVGFSDSPPGYWFKVFYIVVAGVFLGGGILVFFQKRGGLERKKHLREIGDIIFLVPLIVLILTSTGNFNSPWKMLFLPLIIANALKPQKFCGYISVFLAGAALFLVGYFTPGAEEVWIIEEDLAYLTLFVLVFWAIYYFKDVVRARNQELSKTRRSLLAGVARDLEHPLQKIKKNADKVVTGKNPGFSVFWLKKIDEEARMLGDLIDKLFEFIQLENRRAILQMMPIPVESFVQDMGNKFREKGVETKISYFQGEKADDLPQIQVDSNRVCNVIKEIIAISKEGVCFFDCGRATFTVSRQSSNIVFNVRGRGCEKTKEFVTGNSFPEFLKEKNKNTSDPLELLIARHIFELHGGYFFTGRENGKRCGFSFVLPV